MPTLERAARWYRVSGGSQDIASQDQHIAPHVKIKGYIDTGIRYELPGVSAMKGEHVPYLERALADGAAGKWDVLVVSDSARIERRDDDELMLFLIRLRAAGVRIESATEPMFGQKDIGSKIVSLLAGSNNHEYVVKLLKNVGRGVMDVAEGGYFLGSEQWGFESAGAKRAHYLRPTDYARKYLPEIYRRVIDGVSLVDIAMWLTEEKVPTGRAGRARVAPWHATTVAKIIRNTASIGRHVCVRTVKNVDFEDVHVAWVHEFEAVVDEGDWHLANAELDRRGEAARGGKRTGRKRVEPLSGGSWCDPCLQRGVKSPMYRINIGSKGPDFRLRCSGTGPQRKGCGAPLIPVGIARELADSVFTAMRGDDYELYTVRLVPGNRTAIDAELLSLQAQEQQINASDKPREERRRLLAELDKEFERVEAIEITPDQEKRVPTGECIADVYADETRRSGLLNSGEFVVTFGRADGTEDAGRDGWGIWVAAEGLELDLGLEDLAGEYEIVELQAADPDAKVQRSESAPAKLARAE